MVRVILACIIALFVVACSEDTSSNLNRNGSPAKTQSGAGAGDADGSRIAAADSEPRNWLSHGRTYAEQRHSPLQRINAGNVNRLGLAWYREFPTQKGLEATPLVVDGVLYTTGPWNVVYALDAATGEQLWRYDPEVPREWLRNTCCGVSNRGVAFWRGKVYEGTLDGRLVALDAGNGEVVWEVQTTPEDRPYAITGAPRVVNGKVVIGNSGAEFGVRGYVTAYDAETGAQAWRFYTVPGNPAEGFESGAMEMAAKTWSGEWWKVGGGGTAWDSFAFDPELDLLYIGVGNGGPWSRHARSDGQGDNLFLSSIVAVNADTGEYVWHYQTTPGDSWDYTATQPMILADLEIGGETRKVLMQAPKNGFFYVLDRETGELISAENIVPVSWAEGIDPDTGRPIIPEKSYYGDGMVWERPGPIGAHNWKSMSWHPGTGLVYIPVMETFFSYADDPDFEFVPGIWNIAQDPALIEPGPSIEPPDWPMSAHLAAWDPVKQKEAWRIPRKGLWNGGVLTTDGNLLIQGASDGYLYIYRADNGRQLWRMPVQTGIIAAPVTYEVDGEQYIAVNAGWGGTWSLIMGQRPAMDGPMANDRLLVFKLDGSEKLPPLPAQGAKTVPEPPPLEASPEQVKHGAVLYNEVCYGCHGFNAHSGGIVPDLRYMDPQTHAMFKDIVLGGALSANGMVSFADVLSEADAEAIHAYIISQANKARDAQTGSE